MKERNYFLDISRGIAATAVAFFHLELMRKGATFYQNLIMYGWIGVPVFFVISGYSISSSLDNTKSFQSFWIKRILRIYPAYWISILFIFLIAIIQKIITHYNSTVIFPKGIYDIVNTFFCLYKPLTNTLMMNWVYWTLVYELFFYLIFSVVVFIPYLYKKWYYLSIIVISIFYTFYRDIPILFFLKLIGYFGLGVFLNERKKKTDFTTILLFIISVISILMNREYSSGSDGELTSYFGIGTALTFMVAEITIGHLFTRKNIFTKLGDISYGIYLFHVPICIYVIRNITLNYWKDNLVFIVGYDILNILCCIGFSLLIYHTLEMKALNYYKKIEKRQ